MGPIEAQLIAAHRVRQLRLGGVVVERAFPSRVVKQQRIIDVPEPEPVVMWPAPKPLQKFKCVTYTLIQTIVARDFKITRDDLLSERRTANVVRPRQIAMKLCRVLMPMRSLPDIGRHFGGRDHTTVLHALRKIDGMMAADALFADEIERLRAAVLNRVETPAADPEVAAIERALGQSAAA